MRRAPTPSSPPAARSAAGKLHDQFVVDVIQGGAGTSTNMNANEVIANRALEILGPRSAATTGTCTPTSTSTSSQSTNDVYPTALKIATCFGIHRLVDAMATLRGAFAAQGRRVRATC